MKKLVLIALLANTLAAPAFAAPAFATDAATLLQGETIGAQEPIERRSHRCPKRGAREGSTCGGV